MIQTRPIFLPGPTHINSGLLRECFTARERCGINNAVAVATVYYGGSQWLLFNDNLSLYECIKKTEITINLYKLMPVFDGKLLVTKRCDARWIFTASPNWENEWYISETRLCRTCRYKVTLTIDVKTRVFNIRLC